MNEPILKANKLCKTFGSLAAVKDVSLDIAQGEIHAIIGPNGAGKSTLISQICGSLPSDEGSVFLMGKEITNLPTEKRASLGIGRTFQISALAKEDTVLQNAILGSVGASGKHWDFFNPILKNSMHRDKAEYCLELVGLKDLINQKTATLSHGQLRLLEVAIALTLKPKVFIMDEPMAGLGSDGTKQLTNFLDELKNRAPILLVEHDMDAVFALANRITVLDYGRVIASDTVGSIKKDPLVQKAYLGED
jgi:branched-chain amino acid transport system ATP-binding protein|tara:strand:- start:163 stop:909 length:747 start_codon:yes stop_codon:yes gene_type:complete